MKHIILTLGTMLAVGAVEARADEIPSQHLAVIQKGLDYLAKEQKKDGHWEGTNGQYPVTMTALAGIAFLMEGSTLRDGKYSANIRKAVDWFMDPQRCRPNGLIGNPNNQKEQERYMYGHGFGLMFLASVYGEEEDIQRRKKLEAILTKAVEFTGNAQSSRGGWFYTSRADGGDDDEGSVTITQVQALRAARNAGIVVPKSIIDKAQVYLKDCTVQQGLDEGQVQYRPGQPAATPGLTSAGIACMFNAGEYNAPIVKKWFKYCQKNIGPLGSGGRRGHDEYTHYYWAQALYALGEEGYGKLFEKSESRLTWSKYRKETFEHLANTQSSDGSWGGVVGSPWNRYGPIYPTSVYLAVLQLDKGSLPIYQR